ncbi:MAG: glycosyltransferase family 4 protein [Synechococcales bacterium]|nr:glycosyltransferase family 4 protein [Synechococcales bacterium]
MKVLHICALGLTAKHLLKPQIKSFLAQGAKVAVACSPGRETNELQQQGYTIHPIPIERRILSWTNLLSTVRLMRLMQQEQYDIVHVHTPIASVIGRVAAALARVPHVVYTAHGFPFHDRSSWLEYQLYFTVEKVCAALTDLILAQNHEDVQTARRSHLCASDRIAYLGNGIDVDRFSRQRLNPHHQETLRRSLGIPDQANPIIGTIGRLTYKKGSSYLIEAAARLLPRFPNLHILIIGGQLDSDPEPFAAHLSARIDELGLAPHVTLTGYREDIPELLGLLDMFTLPTFTHEGLPRSILEAMGMALPVVATDIRGCREAVVQGETGLIVPPQDSASLAAALEHLMGDEALRRTMGQAGRDRLEQHYDERFVFQRLTNYYHQLQVRDTAPAMTLPVPATPIKTTSK